MDTPLKEKPLMIFEKDRIQSIKRKIDELIGTVCEDIDFSKAKKATSSDGAVKNAECHTKVENLQLTPVGQNAEVTLRQHNDTVSEKKLDPLFIEDIKNLLMKFLYGNLSQSNLQWCAISKHIQVKKIVFLVIEGPSKSTILQNISVLNNVVTIFPCAVEVLASTSPFALELAAVQMTSGCHMNFPENTNKPYSSLFPMDEKPRLAHDCEGKFSKLHLLLSPVQLVKENYPLPNSVFKNSNSNNYCFTKNTYSEVTADSPIFAVDCEMCRTTTGKLELTRVAIVNEKLKTVYSTLVKPENEIVNYLTKYSGITEDMLASVQTSLSDVQKAIQNILPSDAILCGQSLNNDLDALQMFHPYVIDTSVIYNPSGLPDKDSLKNLTSQFLGETIQNSSSGHNPVEDSIAAMKLAQLKLKRNFIYGNASVGSEFSRIKNTKIFNTESGCAEDFVCQFQYARYVDVMKLLNFDTESLESHLMDPKFQCECSTQISEYLRNTLSNDVSKFDFTTDIFIETAKDSFISKLQRSKKKVCLIANKESIAHHYSQIPASNVLRISKLDTKEIIEATICNIENHDLTLSNIIFEENDGSSFSDLDTYVKDLYDAISNETLFMCFVTGAHNEEIKRGLCMLVLKNL